MDYNSAHFTVRKRWPAARVFILHNNDLSSWKSFTFHPTLKFAFIHFFLLYQDISRHPSLIPSPPSVSYTRPLQQRTLLAECSGHSWQPAESVGQSVNQSVSHVPLHGWMWTGRGQTPWWEGPVRKRRTLTWVPFWASRYSHKSLSCPVSAGWQHQSSGHLQTRSSVKNQRDVYTFRLKSVYFTPKKIL